MKFRWSFDWFGVDKVLDCERMEFWLGLALGLKELLVFVVSGCY